MKLNKPPPSTRGTRHQGAFYTRYDKQGRAVVAAWPRPRGAPKSPVTQEQVSRWDRAIAWARTPEPEAYRLALDRSAGSGFYARDIIIMETFGTDLSWPGWGKYPNGASGGEATIPRGFLKSIDAIYKKDAWRNGGTFSVIADLWLPAVPRLYYSTIPPIPILSTTQQEGQSVPHGNRLWLAEAKGEYAPTSGLGTTALSWDVPDPATPGTDIYWWLAEKSGSPPIIHWSTAAYRLGGTGSKPKYGWQQQPLFFTTSPHGVAPNPAFVANADAHTEQVKNCLITRPGVSHMSTVKGFKMEFCIGVDFDGTGWPSQFPECTTATTYVTPTIPGLPVCALPDPITDSYYWWNLYQFSPP